MTEPRFGEVWEWRGRIRQRVMVIGRTKVWVTIARERTWIVINLTDGPVAYGTFIVGEITDYQLLNPTTKWRRIDG